MWKVQKEIITILMFQLKKCATIVKKTFVAEGLIGINENLLIINEKITQQNVLICVKYVTAST